MATRASIIDVASHIKYEPSNAAWFANVCKMAANVIWLRLAGGPALTLPDDDALV
jgi:hypothetical protein